MTIYDVIISRIGNDLGVRRSLRSLIPNKMYTQGRENVFEISPEIELPDNTTVKCKVLRPDRKMKYGMGE